MIHFEDCWRNVRWSKPTPIFGLDAAGAEVPPSVQVHEERLYDSFAEGFRRFLPIYENALSPEVFLKLKEINGIPYEQYELPPALWAKILYEFALAYSERTAPRDDLIESLIPLYLGRTGSYVRATKGMDMRGVEEYIEEQCLVFEETKNFLMERCQKV
jgi:hypothetical protein